MSLALWQWVAIGVIVALAAFVVRLIYRDRAPDPEIPSGITIILAGVSVLLIWIAPAVAT